MPIQSSAERMPSTHSGRLREASVSSIRSTNAPPCWRGVDPVLQRGAGTADMEHSSRRRGKTYAYRHASSLG